MARRVWTEKTIPALKPRAVRYVVPDPNLTGHYVRVTPRGAKTFVAVARAPDGKQIWHTIGAADLYTIDEAREKARAAIKAIREGGDRAGPQSFASVAEQWLKRHAEAKGLRSAPRLRRNLEVHVLPIWAGREFESIRRGDVARLLDDVEDHSGPVAADHILKTVRNISNWYATRHENYLSPIVKGMRRSNPKERARDRILNDDEFRAIWKAAEANGVFGGFIRMLLLTAQRKEKVSTMRWDDITSDGTWIIGSEAREKGNAEELKLPEIAVEIINAQPRLSGNPYVFTGRSGRPMYNMSHRKRAFEAKLPPMPQWGLHDLRRTARSLMSRAGVRPDIAERVLGHAIGGVEGVYDRYHYQQDKANALQSLAALIETIINPPADNVMSFGAGR